jgi:hypothetical protein
MDNTKGLQNIKKMYEKLTYFDQYGGSVILFIIISILLFISISYCFAKINAQPIIDDWNNQRCKPNIIPFAGFITHPEGVSASDYTYQNFTYCTQSILTNITGYMVEPLTFITNMISTVVNDMKNAINSIRAMFDKIRTFFQTMTQELMGRIMNMMIPLQKIIISFRDLIGKVQGTMTAGLFTLLGSYYTLKSLMGAIAQFIITILIAMAAMIVVFWLIPFTWGMATSLTAIFVAIAIPMALILAFMMEVLQVKPALSIPSVKCFDKDTLIPMNDGSYKKISEIVVNDVLLENNDVTGVIKVETNGSQMYTLNNVVVSDSHIVQYNNKWIPVSKHPDAVKFAWYQEPYLYCLNTTNKTIVINNTIFTDWDEIYDNDLIEIKNSYLMPLTKNNEIHQYLDGGFFENTEIAMENGSVKNIKDIIIGDILEDNIKVYGLVVIDGIKIEEQSEYNLGNSIFVKGGTNLIPCDKKINFTSTVYLDEKRKTKIMNKQKKLYHLLTDKGVFKVNKIKFYDYNASIDFFLEKNIVKLLSMKYV